MIIDDINNLIEEAAYKYNTNTFTNQMSKASAPVGFIQNIKQAASNFFPSLTRQAKPVAKPVAVSFPSLVTPKPVVPAPQITTPTPAKGMSGFTKGLIGTGLVGGGGALALGAYGSTLPDSYLNQNNAVSGVAPLGGVAGANAMGSLFNKPVALPNSPIANRNAAAVINNIKQHTAPHINRVAQTAHKIIQRPIVNPLAGLASDPRIIALKNTNAELAKQGWGQNSLNLF